MLCVLLLRFVRTHGVRAMSHWEASPFQTEDGQDVVKAKGPHIVSSGWERVASKDTGGGSSGSVASIAAPLGEAPLLREVSSTMTPHWQRAFLLLVGGLLVFYVRRWLRSQRRPARPAAVAEVYHPCTSLHYAPPCTHWPVRCFLCTICTRWYTSSCVLSRKARGGASVVERALTCSCSHQPTHTRHSTRHPAYAGPAVGPEGKSP